MTLICRLQTLKDQFEPYTIQLGTFLIVIKMKFFSGGGGGMGGRYPKEKKMPQYSLSDYLVFIQISLKYS